MRHLKKGDEVYIIAGKYKKQTGKIIEVLAAKQRVIVEGINVVKKHLKPNTDPAHPEGGIIEKLGTIHWSNVQVLDSKTKKGTRTRVEMNGKEKKRVTLSGVEL